ncbi:DUF58 domain-containing protein [Halomicrobium salinisoli]|uniref:DUF58 domain-containing protein n=1 Tax=Halomicrobium salinisoli TaxID=2878391 RepID=UPI001CF0149E|nr:DUF58 domain-containing protein [Halomicrobium salinisoli]
MQLTRRSRAVAAVSGFLALLGVAAAEPLYLVGAAGIGGWLVARQVRFARAAATVDDGLTVTLRPVRRSIAAGESISATVAAEVERPSPLSLSVTVDGRPTNDPVAVELAPGETWTSDVARFSWPVAGEYALGDVTATFTDDAGLFEQSVDRAPAPSVRVEPRAPRNVHVGEGGDPISPGFGEHDAGRFGSGVEPVEVRQYVPGDAVRQIDWKATARLGEAYVREFEAETDRETMLFLDQRAGMADGPDGERKLDYARAVGLAFVRSAGELRDPLGICAVGDDGVLAARDPTASDDALSAVRAAVTEATPTAGGGSGPAASADRAGTDRGEEVATARRRAEALADDGSAFAETLVPFLDDRRSYVRRFDERPLFRAVRTYAAAGSAVRTVLVTDDGDRAELREAVRVASRGEGQVAVFLTPTALFDGDLADVEAVYDRYVAFEEFRRELAAMDGVEAYEVGPGDRLTTVLRAGRTRRRDAA